MGLRTIFCIVYSKLFNKKVYILSEVTEQSENKISFIKKNIRRFICKNINGGIAHGKLSFRYLTTLGLSNEKITISPDAVDNEFFISESIKYMKSKVREDLQIDYDCFIFLYVGQFIHRKGIDLLISAIQKLAQMEDQKMIRTLIVGGEKKDFDKIIHKYDKKLVIISEFKQKESLVPIYIASDCLIFPSREDVWGMVVNEAIACELPVVVSKYAGCSADLIEDGVNGFIFDPCDEAAFINTLKKCLNNEYKLKLFAERAKEKLSIYNHENAATKVVDFVT